MPTKTNHVVVNDETKTVTIRQEAFTLKANVAYKGYHHAIFATTVNVEKGFTNPGRDLTIYAAQVVVASKGGSIDVSGADGAPADTTSKDAAGYKQGTYNGSDASNGADGGPGINGGSVTIHAARVLGGPLEISSKGGIGGRAQDGGKGKDGGQPEDRKNAARPQPVVVGRRFVETGVGRGTWQDVYGWGDDVKRIGYYKLTEATLHVTRNAQSGRDGGDGGNAGLGGRPGDGGKGGTITLRTLTKLEAKIDKAIAGGLPGAVAKHGTPGQGASPGLGEKYLYKADAAATPIDWSAYDENDDWNKVWNTKNSKTIFGIKVDHFDNLNVDGDYIQKDGSDKKLKLRAPSGNTGKNGGYGPSGAQKAPAVRTANRGADGGFATDTVTGLEAVYRDVPYPYLLMLQRSASRALLNARSDEAADILRWLMVLTHQFRAPAAGASEDAKQRQRLYLESEQALLSRDRDTAGDRLAPRCGYTDIERYSAFVEATLTHIANQEQAFGKFADEQKSIADRKRALAASIAEAKGFITHLTGDGVTPGSILYAREREGQLKTSIAQLDLDILNYSAKLGEMPRTLQEAIDAKIRKEQELSVWQVLEFVGMAAGVAVNFASAASSVMTMVNKVKDFYKEALELTSWGEILKDGIWARSFTEVKGDVSKLLETDEWKKTSGSNKKFIGSVADFWGKIKAYDEIAKSREIVDFKMDLIDVQASVLIFDSAKLDLKKQRNDFKAFIAKFVQDYDEAKDWKHVFADFFDTSETRFDMLAHLADVQAERRELEYQQGVYRRNVELLLAEQNKLEVQSTDLAGDDVMTGLDSNLQMALDQGLGRIVEEARAYRIWTLLTHTFPDVPSDVTADALRTKFHEPLWAKIQTTLSKWKTTADKDFSTEPFIWKREDHRTAFDEFAKTGRIRLTLPVELASNIYFERIVDAKVCLRGATTSNDSPFYCQLRHTGISDFVARDRRIVTCYQEPHTIEFTYVMGNDAEPDYNHKNAVKQPFDTKDDPARIRYSPYAAWEIHAPKDFKLRANSPVYNQDLDLSALTEIELRCDLQFDNATKGPQAKRAPRLAMAKAPKAAAARNPPKQAVAIRNKKTKRIRRNTNRER